MELLLTGVLVFVASTVGTVTGFGISTIMIPVMVLFYPAEMVLLFVGIIHWFGDLWKLILFRRGIRVKLILLFGVTGIVMSFIGARLVFSVSEGVLSRVLGGFLIGYVVFLFFKPDFKLKENNFTALAGGASSGFMAGFFGIGGAVRSMFLSAFDLEKSAYIATAGAIAIVIDTTRIGTYLFAGSRLEAGLMWSLVLFVGISFLGAKLAKKMVNRVEQRYFRGVIAVGLMLVGIKLLITG